MIVKPAAASFGASDARMALPSASFGYMTPTFLLVSISDH